MPKELEVVIRTLVAVCVLFVLTKMLGKRQVSQLSVFEYITGITIGSITAYVSLDLDTSWYLGIIALAVWILVSIGIEYLQLKSKFMRNLIDGTPRIMIKDGKIMEDNLKKERITTDELMMELRKKNVFLAADVEFAVMEPSGDINVLLMRENQPFTPKHLGIKVAPEQAPQAVIMDGEMLDKPLAAAGRSRAWLHTELEKLGVTVDNVFLGQVDAFGQLYVDLFDDLIIVPQPQLRAALFATLKKCEADIELFGLATKNKQAKMMYEECAEMLEKTIKELMPLLHR
ncbi:MAG: DUF421 domain-containing protein [Paenibacillaceae bacterium]